MERPAATAEQIKHARNEYATDEINIDDDALTSVPDDGSGVWVAAWVWLSSELLPPP